jgi:hypothetical protein
MQRKPFKAPDLHASRNRNGAPDCLSYPKQDIYGYFTRLKQQHPQMAKYSNSQIAGWIQDFGILMANEVATNRDGVMLPEGLGQVVVVACKVSEMTASNNIDYATSGKLGVVVHHQNDHSAGYVAKIKYYNDIPRQRFTNHQLWDFKPCRALKKAVVADFMKGNFNRHMSVSNRYRMADIFRKPKPFKPSWRQLKADKEAQELQRYIREEYDEFAFD